jgi:3-hydroxyisobutyrate dehydrogenase
VNQILVSVTLAGVAEAMAFAKKNGLDLAKTISVVSGGAAKSWQLESLGPKMVAHDFRPGFMIDLMQKDLRLVMQSGQEANCSLAASALVHQLFTAAQADGHGRMDAGDFCGDGTVGESENVIWPPKEKRKRRVAVRFGRRSCRR